MKNKRALYKFIVINFIFTIPLFAPPFTDNGNGTVTDTALGLIWQKCSMGQNNDASCSGTATTAVWSDAITYCNNLSLGGIGIGQWRLPNINELQSILDTDKPSSPSITTTIFPSTIADRYWSSTPREYYPAIMRIVYFSNGSVRSTTMAGSCYVRCVAEP